jgi:mono/diheme cytochrome c family protein
MRHLIANIATYTIAALLLSGAACFAWVRSAQLTVTDETTLMEQHRPSTQRGYEWQRLGERSYLRNCANCHGVDGGGWDQYPGLAHAGALAHAEGGRDYLVDVHLYGLTSERWGAPMPPMGHIADVELAACLNYVLVSFGGYPTHGAPLYLPADVARRRGAGLDPRKVNERRPAFTPF